MIFRRAYLDSTLAWTASSSAPLVIPPMNNAYLLGLGLDLQVVKTEQTSPAANTDYLWRLITGLTFGSGTDPFLGINTDARILYWHTRLRTSGRNRAAGYPSGNVTIREYLPLLWGVSPVLPDDGLNLRDVTVGIRRDQGLTMTVNWGAANAIGANITVTAATLALELLYGVLEPGESAPPYRPNWVTTKPVVTSGLGLQMIDPLPTNAIYRRTAVMITQGASPADNRTDGDPNTAVSEVGIKNATGDLVARYKTWDKTRQDQSNFKVADDNGAVPGATLAPSSPTVAAKHNPGVFQWDWREHLKSSDFPKNPYGIDMRGAPQNAYNLAYSVDVATNTVVTELHERVLPQQA